MKSSGVKINQAGVNAMYRQVAAKIERTDARFRDQWAGKPLDEVKPQVHGTFLRIGVKLTEQNIADYANAVSKDEPFRWNLS